MTSIQDCVGKLQCNPSSESCCLGQFTECGKDDELKSILEINIYDENLGDQLTYKKWSQTDRDELETLVRKVDEFISSFLGHFKVYQKHAFTAKNSPGKKRGIWKKVRS